MSFTYDITTDRGKVRFLATDTNASAPILDDDEIDACLVFEYGVKRAAALVLEVIASSETLIAKKMELLDLKIDGPAVAVDLRKSAAKLREQADMDDDALGLGFDVIEMPSTEFAQTERILKQYQRGLI